MIAAVDPHSGEVVGAVGKDDAHRDGVWHATIHVWIVDDESRILLQQRSYEKQLSIRNSCPAEARNCVCAP